MDRLDEGETWLWHYNERHQAGLTINIFQLGRDVARFVEPSRRPKVQLLKSGPVRVRHHVLTSAWESAMASVS